MDQSVPSQTSTVKKIRPIKEPMPAHDDVVPLVTSLDGPSPIYGLMPGDGELRPLTMGNPFQDFGVIPSPGGRTILFTRATPQEDIHGEFKQTDGIYRLTFSSFETERVNFTPKPGRWTQLQFALSHDHNHVAIAETWMGQIPDGMPRSRGRNFTLWLASFDATAPRELITMPGSASSWPKTLMLQWSPDGSTIALAAHTWIPPTAVDSDRDDLFLVKPFTKEGSRTVHGFRLAGSASFSPDGQRLLVAEPMGTPRIFDLNDEMTEPIPYLPGPPTDAKSYPVLRGFADNTRLLVTHQRGKTMYLSSLNPDGTDPNPILAWTGSLDMYPTIAAMPDGYWT